MNLKQVFVVARVTIFLVALLVLGAVVIVFVSLGLGHDLSGDWVELLTSGRLIGPLLGVLAATGGAISEFLRGRAFRAVFGEEIETQDYAVSVPEFVVSPEADAALKAAGLESSRERFKPLNVPESYKAGDIRRIIASSDIEGASYLIDELGRYTLKGPKLRPNTNLFVDGRSFLAFGLQTNPHALSFFEAVNSFSRAIVKPARAGFHGDDPKARLTALKRYVSVTMAPSQGGYSADLLLDSGDGEPIVMTQRHGDEWNIGLVVLSRPARHAGADRRHVYCAGVGHGGTAGSAYWLTHHWRKLSRAMGPSNVSSLLVFTATPMAAVEAGGVLTENRSPLVAQTRELCRIILKS